ncbi:MAG: OmpA family protein, partial [Chitinophagaceae bacterium]
VSRTSIYFKQAESYRLAHDWKKASAAYKECINKSTVKYTDALYWYAVCQRSLNEYAAAEESLILYISAAGLQKNYKKEAEKEFQTLKFIQQQFANRDSGLIDAQKIQVEGSSEKGVFAPVQVNDNLFLLSSTTKDSAMADTANPYHSHLYYATLNNGSFEDMEPVIFPGIDTMNNNKGAAAISSDGNYLYFSRWKNEKDHIASSIYYSRKQAGGWSEPTILPLVNINGYSSKQPYCSTDGKYLFFSSDRPGGSGRFDIWYATINKDGSINEPINAGNMINTDGDEQSPFYHTHTSTLVFSSNSRIGMGGYDLFMSKGIDTTWQLPENMGFPINSSRDESYFFAPANASLFNNSLFSSDRGSGCCLETYRIVSAAKNRRIAGIVRDCNSKEPVAHAEIQLKDASGKKWITTTDTTGRYVFELMSDTYQDMILTITSTAYKQTTPVFKIKNLDESDLRTDKLTNIDLCIEMNLVIKAEDVVVVYFDFDKSGLKPATLSKLDSIYNLMVQLPDAIIQISGYTDGRGSEKYNQVLSDKRARSCADYLIQKGINGDRISFVSFGACCPAEMEIINGRDNPDGRSRNRRALINIKKK